MEPKHKNKLAITQLAGWLTLLIIAGGGCGAPYHFLHYHQPFDAVAESNKTYFHSSQTGRIIPKDACATYCEPGCFGYEPTCWTKWPDFCPGNCPVQGEVVVEVLSDVPTAEYEGPLNEAQPMQPGAAIERQRPWELMEPTPVRAEAPPHQTTPVSPRAPTFTFTDLEPASPTNLSSRRPAGEVDTAHPQTPLPRVAIQPEMVVADKIQIAQPKHEPSAPRAGVDARESMLDQTRLQAALPDVTLAVPVDEIQMIVPPARLVAKPTNALPDASSVMAEKEVSRSNLEHPDMPAASQRIESPKMPPVGSENDNLGATATLDAAEAGGESSQAQTAAPALRDKMAGQLGQGNDAPTQSRPSTRRQATATAPIVVKPSAKDADVDDVPKIAAVAKSQPTENKPDQVIAEVAGPMPTNGHESEGEEAVVVPSKSASSQDEKIAVSEAGPRADRLPKIAEVPAAAVLLMTPLAALPDVNKSSPTPSASSAKTAVEKPLQVSASGVGDTTIKFAADNKPRKIVRIGALSEDTTIRFR